MPDFNDSNSEYIYEQFFSVQEGRYRDAFETLVFLEPEPKFTCPNCDHPLKITLWTSAIDAALGKWDNI